MARSVISFFIMMSLLAFYCGTGCLSSEPEFDPDFKPGPEDVLSKEEKEVMIRSAQKFLVRNKNLRLLDEQKKLIETTQPKVIESYQGKKYGTLELEWQISRLSTIYLKSTGRLIQERPNWQLEIRTTHATNPVPEGFLKGELAEEEESAK